MLAKVESLSYEIVLKNESGATIYKVSGDAMVGEAGYWFGDDNGIVVGAKMLLGFRFQPSVVDLKSLWDMPILETRGNAEERDPEDYRGTQ